MNDTNTNTLTYETTRGVLRGLATVAAQKDTRYYLRAVCLDPARGLAIATDGHKMLICALRPEDGVAPKNTPQCLIPLDAIKAACKGKAGAPVTVTVTYENAQPATIALTDPETGTGTQCKPVDGRFPVYDRVTPDKASGEPGQFNPAYVKELHAALCAVAGVTPASKSELAIAHNGNNAAAVTLPGLDGAAGVLMPMRIEPVDPILAFAFMRDGNDTTASE